MIWLAVLCGKTVALRFTRHCTSPKNVCCQPWLPVTGTRLEWPMGRAILLWTTVQQTTGYSDLQGCASLSVTVTVAQPGPQHHHYMMQCHLCFCSTSDDENHQSTPNFTKNLSVSTDCEVMWTWKRHYWWQGPAILQLWAQALSWALNHQLSWQKSTS